MQQLESLGSQIQVTAVVVIIMKPLNSEASVCSKQVYGKLNESLTNLFARLSSIKIQAALKYFEMKPVTL